MRQRANSRCEYCGKPEGISVYPHHLEHIISKKHSGSSDLKNLAWACFHCNVCKGTDIASYDAETGELSPLFNPRTQSWTEHFELLTDGRIIGKSPVGRVTVTLLQMNHPEEQILRRQMLSVALW